MVSIKGITKAIKVLTKKYLPEILVSVGITGMFCSVAMTVKATSKSIDDLEDAGIEKEDIKHTSAKTVIKTVWKNYIPTASMAVASTACIVSATVMKNNRHAALMAAYALSEKALEDYKETAEEFLGHKKATELKEQVAIKKAESDPVSSNEVIVTQKGMQLCYDAHAGRYFLSDIDIIKRSIETLRSRLQTDNYVTLNDFYELLGLQPTEIGYSVGWEYYGDVLERLPEVFFGSCIADDGRPAIVMEYDYPPRYLGR